MADIEFRRATARKLVNYSSPLMNEKVDSEQPSLNGSKDMIQEHKFYFQNSVRGQIINILGKPQSNKMLAVVNMLMDVDQQRELVKIRQ